MFDRCCQDRTGEERGQALLEFALVIVMLFLLLFAIIDFARIFFAYSTMSNGVREGARFAIVHPQDNAAIEAAARRMMIVVGGEAQVQVIFPDTQAGQECRSHACPVRVIATSNFPVWTPVIPNIQIIAQATMHIE